MSKAAPTLALLLTTLAAGCGGSGKTATPPVSTSGSTGTRTTAPADPRTALEASVRDAIHANDRLSGYVLAHNSIPAWAKQSTRGPALAALRTSAAQRGKRGIQVRTLADRLQIVSLTLDPSYTRATAIVRSRQRVRPYRNNDALGQSVKLDEKGRFELHRVGRSQRFVVWQVVGLK